MLISLYHFISPSHRFIAQLPMVTQFVGVRMGSEPRSACSKAQSPSRIIPSPSKSWKGEPDRLCLPYKYAIRTAEAAVTVTEGYSQVQDIGACKFLLREKKQKQNSFTLVCAIKLRKS